VVPVSAIVVLCILLIMQQVDSGIQITIKNTGSTPLRSVVLYVTGKEYPLDDVAPGASAHTTVNSTGISHLEIGFTDVGGDTKRLNAGGYFASDFRGTIGVSIKDGAIAEIDHKVTAN
jgi:hypothetical protein